MRWGVGAAVRRCELGLSAGIVIGAVGVLAIWVRAMSRVCGVRGRYDRM